jgi:hypothetical protein
MKIACDDGINVTAQPIGKLKVALARMLNKVSGKSKSTTTFTPCFLFAYINRCLPFGY